MRSKEVQEQYRQFRTWQAAGQALHSAKTVVAWQPLEAAGLVRLRAEPEDEPYWTTLDRNMPKKECEEIMDAIERHGDFCVCSEYWDGRKWRVCDSIGHCAGYENVLDPHENCYVVDLMSSAIGQVPQGGEH